jgi:pyruvate dehydrogenase E2 component (dihydrolipoamide acetyltransferase)
MVREFKLPDVGEGLTEAEIVRWLVEPGETVSEDQPVAEVETDKAVVEVPSPVNGAVREILAEEGEMVKVGTVIITFDVEGETRSASEEASDGPDEVTEATDSEPEPTATEAADTGATETDDGTPAPTKGRVFASPSTRRAAREQGIDIGGVGGSGPGGRVTEADIHAAAADSDGEKPAATGETGTPVETDVAGDTSATRRITDEDSEVKSATHRVPEKGEAAATDTDGTTPASVESADRDRTLAAPATRKLAEGKGIDIDAVPTEETRDGEPFVTPEQVEVYAEAQQRAQEADAEAVSAGAASETGAKAGAEESAVTAAGEDERLPYRGVRRTIGKQMERSKYTAPHVTHHDDVDVTRLVETRSRLKERAAERGAKLTYLPFVTKAVVAALEEYPILNSQLDEENEEIVLRGEYNIGVATATDAGLMVPVIANADEKGMLELAEEMDELVGKARNRAISREEMQGGTFTLTNFGAVGGEYATPIINYPETAILGLGAIKDKPRVVEREQESPSGSASEASKEVVPRKVMTLSLSIDHRVIDGAEAAQFVNTVKEYLESPELLLLE